MATVVNGALLFCMEIGGLHNITLVFPFINLSLGKPQYFC